MVPLLGQLGSGVKLPVQVRPCPEEIATVDAFTAELSQRSRTSWLLINIVDLFGAV